MTTNILPNHDGSVYERVNANQLEFPLDYAPPSVRRHGLMEAHPRPLVSLGKRPGHPFVSFRTSPAEAWKYPELQYAHAGSSIAALVLDADRPDALARALCDLPPPNWIVWRPANDHSHVVWTLRNPVHRHPAARADPLKYLAAIAEYFAYATGADPSYNGILAHNPMPAGKSGYSTTWGCSAPYFLDQLAKVIPFNWRPPVIGASAIGRNADLYLSGMKWAGRKANAKTEALAALIIANQSFPHPLPVSEVAGIARSIESYRKSWSERGWHRPSWIARQAARGRKGLGKARKASASTKGSNNVTRPWEAEGISRRTWYRNRRKALQARQAAHRAFESIQTNHAFVKRSEPKYNPCKLDHAFKAR